MLLKNPGGKSHKGLRDRFDRHLAIALAARYCLYAYGGACLNGLPQGPPLGTHLLLPVREYDFAVDDLNVADVVGEF